MFRVADGSLMTVPRKFSSTLHNFCVLDLAAEPRGCGHTEGQVEHIFLFFARRGELRVHLLLKYHVARAASATTTCRPEMLRTRLPGLSGCCGRLRALIGLWGTLPLSANRLCSGKRTPPALRWPQRSFSPICGSLGSTDPFHLCFCWPACQKAEVCRHIWQSFCKVSTNITLSAVKII